MAFYYNVKNKKNSGIPKETAWKLSESRKVWHGKKDLKRRQSLSFSFFLCFVSFFSLCCYKEKKK